MIGTHQKAFGAFYILDDAAVQHFSFNTKAIFKLKELAIIENLY